MFFDVYVPFRAKKELLDKIEITIKQNPDREFESRGHFIRSAVLYYCRYLDDLKYKAGLEKTTKYKPVTTFKKPVKVSFRNKYGEKVSFTATKIVKKKVTKRQKKEAKK